MRLVLGAGRLAALYPPPTPPGAHCGVAPPLPERLAALYTPPQPRPGRMLGSPHLCPKGHARLQPGGRVKGRPRLQTDGQQGRRQVSAMQGADGVQAAGARQGVEVGAGLALRGRSSTDAGLGGAEGAARLANSGFAVLMVCPPTVPLSHLPGPLPCRPSPTWRFSVNPTPVLNTAKRCSRSATRCCSSRGLRKACRGDKGGGGRHKHSLQQHQPSSRAAGICLLPGGPAPARRTLRRAGTL